MPRLDFYNYDDLTLFVRIKLTDRSLLIGRSSDCHVQLPNEKVSRIHATILVMPEERYSLKDCSANGTRVNGAIVEGETELNPGDRIYIENYIIIYQPKDAPVEDLTEDRTLRG
ncbi:FHA domain-containing protein [Sulfidibacter corallicola]|uniref:FHA domain-containing protein n=1 Tax=Sulfidibacter corallicola TaxID=2818388 RepID=A0A8A4TK89_SULCO|nr:FHA domain-containing protein [Sulfidibacter corallicola]QTD49897.1 FHA domain-containing protein [Sulfidibacter corallicola]